jgi:uncharacterized protein (TIGR04141 family)
VIVARQQLTAYLVQGSVAREVSDAEVLLAPDASWAEATLEIVPGEGARLFIAASEPRPPAWQDFLEVGTSGELRLGLGVTRGAVLVVQVRETRTRSRLVVFVFGAGRFSLRSEVFEPSFGLKVALNLTYPRGTRADELTRLRSVDAKTIDEVSLSTRVQASKSVDIDAFGLDIRRDLLRAVVGRPRDAYWGKMVAGADSFRARVSVSFPMLGDTAAKLVTAFRAGDYRERFAWIDYIQPVRDGRTRDRLNELVVEAVGSDSIDLVGPEGLDLDRVDFYRFTGERTARRELLVLRDYVAYV